MLTREKLMEDWLDYRNNYLTVEKYAEHRLLTVEQAKQLIELGKSCFETDIERVL